MTRPLALPVRVDAIPAPLRADPRWVCWRYILRDGRWTKLPFQPSGAMARVNDASTWTTFAAAVAALRSAHYDGLGFVLGDGWSGIDLDATTGESLDAWEPYVTKTPGYCERSPSNTGYKIFGRSPRIGGEVNFGTTPPTITAWNAARYFAVTGHDGDGSPLDDLTGTIDAWFPPAPPVLVTSTREGYVHASTTTDDDLFLMMVGSANGDKFFALWRGDMTAYADNHSRADFALVSMLAWWCDYDLERADRFFRRSGLMREHWTKSASYRRATLTKAASLTKAC